MKAKLTTRAVEAAAPDAKPYIVSDSEIPGLQLRVQPSGSKSYYVRFMLNGSRKVQHLGNASVLTPAQARTQARKVLSMAAQGQEPETKPKRDVTLKAIVEDYLAHCRDYHGPTSEMDNIQRSLLRLVKLHGGIGINRLSPKRVKELIERMIEDGCSRSAINRTISHIKGFAKWAVSEELCPPSVHQALSTISGLRAGKTAARETEKGYVPTEAEIFQIAQHMPGSLGDALRIQFFTGARPGELLGIKPQDVDTDGSVWRIQVMEHKTACRGHSRTLYAGPEAQRILKPYLLREHDLPCFRPQDAVDARSERSTVHRRENQAPNPRKTSRTLNAAYDVNSYRRALERACRGAGVERFSPHKVRHCAGARFRREYGLDVCQRLLGHRHAAVSEIYAQADERTAMQAMSELG